MIIRPAEKRGITQVILILDKNAGNLAAFHLRWGAVILFFAQAKNLRKVYLVFYMRLV